MPPDQLGLDGFEERLDGGVSIAISFTTHRRFEVMLTQDFLVVIRTVLRATVCVMNAAFGWLTQSNGHIQCTYGQIPLHAIANGPANHTPRIQIKNDSKVKPPFVRPNIGYIARPFLVWPISRKVLIKQIG